MDLQIGVGSIPTPVGEPRPASRPPRRRRVYPHACGGTPYVVGERGPELGLSPRLWGNRDSAFGGIKSHGSIPTPVGEPSCCRSGSPCWWVYPHACGGTLGGLGIDWPVAGLSPRLWGNRFLAAVIHGCAGSIPTPVGEPSRCVVCLGHLRVYPHACGGTFGRVAIPESA